MADKIVIVKIEYDVEGSVTAIKELTSTIEGERVAQAQLKDELEKGKISQKEYSIQVAKSKETANNANAERKSTIKLLASEKGSNDALRAEIKKLTIARDKLNKTTQQGNKDYTAYNKKIKALQETLKDTSGGASKTGLSLKRMWEFAGGIGIAALAKKAFDLLKQGIVNLVESSEILTERWEAMAAGIKAGSLVIKQYSIDALESATKGADEGITKFNKFTNALGAFFVAFGDANRTAEESAALYKKIRYEANAASLVAIKYTRTMQELEEAEIAQIVPRAKAIEQLKEAQALSRDENIPLRERIPLLQKEIELIKQQGADALGIQQQREQALAALRQSYINLGMQSQWTDAMERSYQQEVANTFNIQTEYLNQTRRAEAQLATMKKEVRAEEKKAEENRQADLKKNQQAGSKAAEETMEANRKMAEEKKKADEEELHRRGELIWKLAELKQQELENDAKTLQEKRDLQIQFADKEMERALAENESIEIATAEHNLRLEEIEQEYQANIKEQRQRAFDEQYEALQQIVDSTAWFANDRVTIISDAFARIATIDWKEVKTAQDAFLAIGQAAQGLTALIVAGNQAEFDDLEAQKNAELKLAGDNEQAKSRIEAKYNKKLVELKRKQFKEEKAAAIVNASIATALAIVKGLASGLPLPGLVMAGLAALLGGFQIAAIARQKAPAFTSDTVFAEGGAVIGGKPHSLGGTKFFGQDGSMFEAEKGEAMFILKKDATAEIAALSMLNEMHGGRSWDRGASHLAEGGEVASVNVEAMVDEAMQRTPIIVKVGDIETGLTDYSKVKSAGVI